jgi:hypothetical protein
MSRLLLAGLLLGPPATEPAPAPEYDEAVIIEAAPLMREPELAEPLVEPPPEFVDPLTMPLGPTTVPLPPPPPPPDGAGRLVGGSLAIGLGIGAFVAVDQEVRRQTGNPTYVAATFVPLGLASLGIGTYLLIRGGKARANFRHWKEYTGYEVPPQGNGLLVGGTMLATISGVVLITGTMRSTRGQQDLLTTVLLSAGGAGLLAGGAQLAIGVVRREKYRRWRRNGLLMLSPPWIAPIAEGGAAVGVVGRF